MMKPPIIAAVLLLFAATTARAVDAPPSYRDAPVFFEVVRGGFGDPRNDRLVLEDKIVLPPLGIANISDFDWTDHQRESASWWLRIERFDYLVPLIESERDDHRRFVERWIMGWYATHKGIQKPNNEAWQGMVAGMRAMVLVRCLEREDRRPDPDAAFVATLRDAIEEHQRFLAGAHSFESRSNHGHWNAMGLFETTRVFADAHLTKLALERLMQLTADSVSREGLHREHSPSYHFNYLDWISDDIRYMRALEGWHWPEFPQFVNYRNRMRDVAYYLFDHDGMIARVGDSGGRAPEAIRRTAGPRRGCPWLFAPEAGYAIFKDDPSGNRRRYLVFNIQNLQYPTELIHHFHNDVASIFYSDDGEIILSDQGRYSYAESDARDYFRSLSAHNTVFPARYLTEEADLQFGRRAWMNEKPRRVTFGVDAYDGQVARSVTIPKKGGALIVRDNIVPGAGYVALWNIGPDVETAQRVPGVEEGDGETFRWLLVTRRGRRFTLAVTITGNKLAGDEVVEEVRGSRDPRLGWYAPAPGKMEPSLVLRFNLEPREPSERLSMVTRVDRDD